MVQLANGDNRLCWDVEDIDFHITNVILENINRYEEIPREFTDEIDETNEPVKIEGLEYPPSHVLASTDPIALIQEFINWQDNKVRELEEEKEENEELE